MGNKTESDTSGDAPVQLRCTSCDTDYYTDETMLNDCPKCGSHYDWEVAE